jgi:endonuclease/exonuclease/phosphatase family metal-dependent hydrolase
MCFVVLVLSAQAALAAPATAELAPELRVATWNIWHGGREDGETSGPAKVVDVLREIDADVFALQETYGSGELLAEALGMQLFARGTNVSLLTKFNVLADLSVDEPFRCVGALLGMPDERRVAVYSLWLPYDADIWLPGSRQGLGEADLAAACEASRRAIGSILAAIDVRLAEAGAADVPVILAGDFNSMSHLDYTELARDMHGAVVRWPTSVAVAAAGYQDVYRALHPRVDRARDRTWSPRFPEQEQDRIDFVHVRGPGLVPVASRVVHEHPAGFPSDHAAVVADFEWRAPAAATPLRIVAASSNIRHGHGLDDGVDLGRTGELLEGLAADFVALQEVDQGVGRSGRVNQAEKLGEHLGWHAAFGAFMPYGGGHYGLGLVSRFPLHDVEAWRLPDGNEPRIALTADLHLPDGRVLKVVNVHFDWVDDDGFRFAQAAAVASRLKALDRPYVMLGDFNDQPGSRTLALFEEIAHPVAKVGPRDTWPSEDPSVEIDHVFVGPRGAWQVQWTAAEARVVRGTRATDHCPVVAELLLAPVVHDAGPR